MRKWTCFVALVCFATILLKAQPACEDTNKVVSEKTDEISEMLDNLANINIFSDTVSTTNLSTNPFFITNDSNLSYKDSMYRASLYLLSLSSPFEYVYNDIVKNYIELYGIKRANLTSRMLGLSEIYFPLFEEYLDKYQLPMELKYLAIVESALNPIARSRAGATGLWQFMFNTGKLYGLKVTSYTDDRKDPLKATIAACEHLRDLYNTFNDWALALAAYNAGAGNVNRAIIRAKLPENEKPNFWNIRSFLPRETQNYVPAFIGVSYVMKNYDKFGINPIKPDFTYNEIDTFIINKPLSFEQIEKVLCIPEDEISFLNPLYTKKFIPASDENPQVLRLRKNYVNEYLENEYTLFTYENKVVSSMFSQQLAASKNNQKTNNKSGNNQNKSGKNYVVKKGESLNIIARKFNCSVSDIMDWNNLKSPMIHPNQKLIVSATVATNTNNKNPISNVTDKDGVANNNSKIIYHTIRKGDTLWDIANKYNGVSIEEIKKLNNLKNHHKLMPGQKIKIAVEG